MVILRVKVVVMKVVHATSAAGLAGLTKRYMAFR